MAPTKLAALLAIAAVIFAFTAAPTATAYPGYGGAPEKENCQTQIGYFINCLARDEIRGQCCSVVEDHRCLCQLKQEVAVPCHPHRRHGQPCPGKGAPAVSLSELEHLPCFQGLKCY